MKYIALPLILLVAALIEYNNATLKVSLHTSDPTSDPAETSTVESKPDWAIRAEFHMVAAMRQSAFADQIILGYDKAGHSLSKEQSEEAKRHALLADWHRQMAIKNLTERRIP